MLSVDTPTLTNIIKTCFNLSMDGRVADDQQSEFLVTGKRLRGCLVNLLSAQFNDGTQQVLDANQQLNQINQRTAHAADSLAATANILNQINTLVHVLDDLLKLAASFH
jgi:hypothetical protein